MRLFSLLLIITLTGLSTSCIASPVFEDILNAMQIDQSLQRSGDDYEITTRDQPLGQTFVTGDSVQTVCRLALNVAAGQDWASDESLVATVWDSPEKKTDLGHQAMLWSRRQWSGGIMMFEVEAAVKPNTSYFFELTVEGGDGKIGGILLSKIGIDYPSGDGFKGGKAIERNVWFETYVKKTPNRDSLYAEFFGNYNLDYTGMEKVKAAVGKNDWDAACKAFLAYYENRKGLFEDDLAKPKLDPKWDTKEADLVADQKWPTPDGIVDLGPNWNYHASWATLGGVGLTRTGLMKPLAFTYTKTGYERYARAWNSMLISMFRNFPSPLKSGVIKTDGRIRPTIPTGISGSLWDSISLAARIHHETFYNRFRKNPLFTEDARMGWWANLTDMVNCLERMDAGGNWTTQNTSALFSFAQKYPEYKKAKNWFTQGFDGLTANLLENAYTDGPLKEATTGYHCFSVGMFFNCVQRGKEMGLKIPPEVLDRLERTFDYPMYSTQPDWCLPVWGDTNRIQDPGGLLQIGAKYFGRPDMLWVATRGKEGKMPTTLSQDFPVAGYYIMRDKWGSDGKTLITRNGETQSHYHNDQLSVVLNAWGKDLLPDAGIYIYGTPECNDLTLTRTHSTIGVDGKNILHGAGENTWKSSAAYDFFQGTSPGYEGLPGVKHQRAIVFVKPDYWVVFDNVTGTGEHDVVQRWHFAPGTVDMDASSLVTRTVNAAGPNLVVHPVGPSGFTGSVGKDVFAVDGMQVVHDAPVASYEVKAQLPVSFCTVLFPYRKDVKGQLQVKQLQCTDRSVSASVVGVAVTHNRGTDYVIVNQSGKEVLMTGGIAARDVVTIIRGATDK